MPTCVPCVCLVQEEARRGVRSPAVGVRGKNHFLCDCWELSLESRYLELTDDQVSLVSNFLELPFTKNKMEEIGLGGWPGS